MAFPKFETNSNLSVGKVVQDEEIKELDDDSKEKKKSFQSEEEKQTEIIFQDEEPGYNFSDQKDKEKIKSRQQLLMDRQFLHSISETNESNFEDTSIYAYPHFLTNSQLLDMRA